jgi:hypothetical protein
MLLSSRPRSARSPHATVRSYRHAALTAGLLAALLLPAAESRSQTWLEDPCNDGVNADDIVGQTTAFDPADSAVEFIEGDLQLQAGEDDDVDLYRVQVDNFELFRFTAEAIAANLDPKIYLFYGDGRGIATRDDGRPGLSDFLHPELPVDCETDEDDVTVCGGLGYGDLPSGEYLLGITRSDIVPYGVNPAADPELDLCPDGSAPETSTCPIFPSTSDNSSGEWDFSAIVNPHPGMENQSVSRWQVVPPPVGPDLVLTGPYTAELAQVLFASDDDSETDGGVVCTVPEPSSSMVVGCGTVLLLRGISGSRRRRASRRAAGH